MRIEFENLGAIKKGIIDLKSLNIFCGQNNTGKTYINYLIYTILEVIKNFEIPIEKNFLKEYTPEKREIILDFTEFIKEEDIKEILRLIENEIKEKLSQTFSVDKEFFKDFEIKFKGEYLKEIEELEKAEEKMFFWATSNDMKCIFEKKKNSRELIVRSNGELSMLTGEMFMFYRYTGEAKDKEIECINRAIFKFLIKILFPINRITTFPAERSSLSIFYKELLLKSYNLLDSLMRDERDFDKIKNLMSKYPKPLNSYINFLNRLTSESLKENKGIFFEIAKKIEDKILNGKYQLDDDKIIYNNKDGEKKLELYTTSSLVKTIVGITFYLKYMARKYDYFLIDEPELNLHPSNQRQLARIFAMMINSGIKVIMTTHSPYIMNEFNNLIMLGKISDQERKEEIMLKHKISEEEILNDSNISSYLIINGQTEEMKKTDYGLELDTFNEVIDEMNDLNDEIYSAIED